MEDPEYKGLISQFGHDITFEESKSFNKNDLKRSEPAVVLYRCSCTICYLQAKNKLNLHSHKNFNNQNSLMLKQRKGFTWLLEKIGEITSENICKLNIPDTAVFRKGKVAFLLQHQRDRSLKCVNSGERITNQEIIKNITNIVRNRKKEETSYRTGKFRPSSAAIYEYGRETACLKFMSKGKDNDIEEILSSDEDGAMRVMVESEFTELMWQRPGSGFWKTLAYIQSVLKCRNGIGESFVHEYNFTNVDSNEVIKAGLEDNEENEEIIYLQGKPKYCEYIFMRLYYFFEKYLNLMLVYIKAEFLRDDNNRIWLINASDIDCVPIAKVEETGSVVLPPSPIKLDEDQLLNHLAHTARQPKNHRTETFSKIMNQECEKMIDASKIMDVFKPAEPDLISTAAFSKLRRFTPYNLEELLNAEKAKSLLKVYTENKKQKRRGSSEIKGIDYDSHVVTRSGFSPKKMINTWNYTPQIRVSPLKSVRRPMSSSINRASTISSLML